MVYICVIVGVPSSVCSRAPVATSHTFIVLSPEAEERWVPSGLYTTDVTLLL